jgi:hypothetical protein
MPGTAPLHRKPHSWRTKEGYATFTKKQNVFFPKPHLLDDPVFACFATRTSIWPALFWENKMRDMKYLEARLPRIPSNYQWLFAVKGGNTIFVNQISVWINGRAIGSWSHTGKAKFLDQASLAGGPRDYDIRMHAHHQDRTNPNLWLPNKYRIWKEGGTSIVFGSEDNGDDNYVDVHILFSAIAIGRQSSKNALEKIDTILKGFKTWQEHFLEDGSRKISSKSKKKPRKSSPRTTKKRARKPS